MNAYVQIDIQIITLYVPLEITGHVNRKSFYYRGRHGRWSIWNDVDGYAETRECIAEGKSDEESSVSFAMRRIVEHVIGPAYTAIIDAYES